MTMSRDSGYKFRNFSFSPNSIFTSGKVTKFEGNWLKNKTLQEKTKLGVEDTPVLIGLNLLDDYYTWGTQLLLRLNFRKSFSQHFDWIFVTFCTWLQTDHHKKNCSMGSPEGGVNTWN